MKVPNCIPKFIIKTSKGNRNQNLFNAINHVRRFNPECDYSKLYNVALKLNQLLQPSLNEKEVSTITSHVLKKRYKSSCKKYEKFCESYPCNFHGVKYFKDYQPGWWKYLDYDNSIINIPGLVEKHVYLWEIMDTSKLDSDQVERVHELRDEKGMSTIIDEVLKLKGLPIGDEAYMLWENFRSDNVGINYEV